MNTVGVEHMVPLSAKAVNVLAITEAIYTYAEYWENKQAPKRN